MDSTLDFSSATTITLFSLTLLILYFFRPSKGSQYREAPIALGAWPILGHIPLLNNSQKPHVTLGEMADTYGPIFTIKLGNKKGLVINNWEMAKECFTTNDIAVSSRPQLVAIDHLTYNQALLGFAPYGPPYWREMRKIITSAFLSNHRIDLLSHVLVSIIHDSTKELFNVWSSRKKEHCNGFALVELKQWLGELTFNIVRRCCIGKGRFGVTNNNSDARRIVKALRDLMHHFGVFTVSDVVPLLRRLDLGGHERAMKETAKEWDNILSEWLEEHRREWTSGEDVESEQDFMDVMHSRIDGRMMIQGHDADSIIKATTLALIAGAIDPTTVTITWAMCLLLNNPDTLEKVKEELRVQIGEERLVTDSDLSKLIYLQAVVKETLRLYPANPLSSPRTFAEDCTLGGYHVKKGTRLITNLWKIHTDPNIWQDPFEFKPERFLTTHKYVDVKGHHFELLPFGSGRRVCPGISFGLRIVHLTLASFLHSFDILVPSSEVIDMSESFGLTNVKATPLEVLIKPRLSPKLYETK